MEAATWNGPNLQRTSTRLGLRTEASGRFEKQLAPEQAMDGQVVATQLMLELCGARLAGGHDRRRRARARRRPTIRLRDERVERAAAATAVAARTRAILGAWVRRRDAATGSTYRAAVAAQRRQREADLVEEVARLGFEPAGTLPRARAHGRLSAAAACAGAPRRARRRGAARGGRLELRAPTSGAGCASRGDPRPVVRCATRCPRQPVMRTTLLGSCWTPRRNRSRGMPDVRLFEIGAVYFARPRPDEPRATESLPDERTRLAGLLAGTMRPASWREPEPPRADFFAAKAVLGTLMEAIRADWALEPAREPFLHPGRAARLTIAGEPAGWLGELHPVGERRLGRGAGGRLRARLALLRTPRGWTRASAT
jgi:phenylalanyl-tRNA synthetase beta chain